MRSRLDEILKNGYQLGWWKNTAFPYAKKQILSKLYTRNDGTSIMDEDWDNLIILDGCRYDLFKEVNTINGVLESRISLGSTSQEYFKRNFNDEEYYDTVYISANPFIKLLNLEQVFYHVENTWDTEWNNSLHTVEPGAMAEATMQAYEMFPNKRIIAHFMQPHHPFIGEFGQQMMSEQTGFNNNRHTAANTEDEMISETKTAWNMLDNGELDVDTVKRAYKENLEITLPHVRQLIEQMGQKTVITADHGNLINKRVGLFRMSGHPGGIHVEELVKVPWLITEKEPRKNVINEQEPLESVDVTTDIEDRLKHLGYA